MLIYAGGRVLGNTHTHTHPRPLTLVLLGGGRSHGWWEPSPFPVSPALVFPCWSLSAQQWLLKNMTYVASHPHDDSVIMDLNSAFYLCISEPPLSSHWRQPRQVSPRTLCAQFLPRWSTFLRPLTPLPDSFTPDFLGQAHPPSSYPSKPTSALPKEKGEQLCTALDLAHQSLSRLDPQTQTSRSPAINIKEWT